MLPDLKLPAVLISACLLGASAVCLAQNSPAEPSGARATPAPAKGAPAVPATAAGLPDAPDFAAKDLNGKTFHLSDFRGKAVLLNFWAIFCVPCKTEMPWLDQFQKQYRDQGLVVLGISTFDDEPSIRKFVKTIGVEYTIAAGDESVEDRYPATAMPFTVYIDRNGKIVDQVMGLKKREVIDDEIKRILASGNPPKVPE